MTPTLADEDYVYITTVGRVTGKPHTVEIWFGTNGDTIYVLAGSRHDADFVKNAKKQPAVDVRIASTQFAGTARIVTRSGRRRARAQTPAREVHRARKYGPR